MKKRSWISGRERPALKSYKLSFPSMYFMIITITRSSAYSDTALITSSSECDGLSTPGAIDEIVADGMPARAEADASLVENIYPGS